MSDVMKASSFKITFANEEQHEVLEYDPRTRCAAIRDVKGKRDFTSNKGTGTSNATVAEMPYSVDTSGMTNPTCKSIADSLLSKKVNNQGDTLKAAQMIGILANIERESNYSASKVTTTNNVKYYGICQWSAGRATKMQNACGGMNKWQSNLTGQIDYLWTELTTGFRTTVLAPIISVVDDTKEGAYKAMEIFCHNFKSVSNLATEVAERKKIVDKLWGQIKITGFTGSGTKHNLTEEQIKRLVVGCIQENGSSQKAIQAEASLMCNLAEKSKKYSGDVYNYVLNSGWFGKATRAKINGSGWKSVTADQYKWGYAVFNGGLRTVPEYINEHDWFPNDISWVKYNGSGDKETRSGMSRDKLIPGKSIIHNIYGSTYTFWMFMKPNNAGDPYGSTYYPTRY